MICFEFISILLMFPYIIDGVSNENFANNCTTNLGLIYDGLCYTLSISVHSDKNEAELNKCNKLDSIGIHGHAAWVYNQAQLDALGAWDSRLLPTSTERVWTGLQQGTGGLGTGTGWFMQGYGTKKLGPLPSQAIGEPLQLSIWKDTQPNDNSNNNNYSQLKLGKLYDVENNDGKDRAILCQYSNPNAITTSKYSLSNGNFGEMESQPKANATTTFKCSLECSKLGRMCGVYSFNHSLGRCRLALIDPSQLSSEVGSSTPGEIVTVYMLTN